MIAEIIVTKFSARKSHRTKWLEILPVCSQSNGNFVSVIKKLIIELVDGTEVEQKQRIPSVWGKNGWCFEKKKTLFRLSSHTKCTTCEDELHTLSQKYNQIWRQWNYSTNTRHVQYAVHRVRLPVGKMKPHAPNREKSIRLNSVYFVQNACFQVNYVRNTTKVHIIL